MKVKYVDAHCHIQFEQYSEDGEELIKKMYDAGVAGIVVGVDKNSSEKALALSSQHEHLYSAVGLHPNYVQEEVFDSEAYRALAEDRKVVAIGECGLDFFRPTELTSEVKEKQKDIFYQQCMLAGELNKPLIIHARPSKGTVDAYQELISLLTRAKETYPNLRGDIHFFVGGIPEMQALVALDFTVSFTAVITFARDYDEVIKATSLTAILSETDAPYIAPASRRGERNDPLTVQDVVAQIADIRGEDLEMVREALLGNAKRLFTLT